MRVRGLAVLLCLFTLFGCSRAARTPSKAPQLKLALRSVVTSLDPIRENTLISNSIYCNIFEPLVSRDSQMRVVPALATDWLNPDDRTWVFHLDPHAVFHNGQPVQADDVVYSLTRAHQEPFSMVASSLAMMESANSIDAKTVRIVTRKPYPVLLSRLADIYIVPRSYKDSHSGIIPGSGPYRVSSWKAAKYVELEAYDGYRKAMPAIRSVRFEAIEDLSERMNRFLKGDVDILPVLEPSVISDPRIVKKKDFRVLSTPGLMVLYLAMDVGRAKTPYLDQPQNPFRDIRVRQAIYSAIDIRYIIHDILKDRATEATQLVAAKVFGFNPNLKRQPYDPEKSRLLLKQAGYPKGFRVRLDLTNNRYRNDVQIGEAIARDLGKVGIQVQLNARHKEDFFQAQMDRDLSFYMVGWAVPSADASGAMDYIVHTVDTQHGYGGENFVGYSNPDVDRLIEDSASLMDPARRVALQEEAMSRAMADVVFIPLHIEDCVIAVSARVVWEPRSDEYIYLNTIRFH